MTDGWASRFVSNLFTRYNVLFIGYSLNDPVMRYIINAIAADRKSGEENIKEVFALTDYDNSEKSKDLNSVKNHWKSFGITPILYDSINKHELLNNTLVEWAIYCKDSISYSEKIFQNSKNNKPVKGEFRTIKF